MYTHFTRTLFTILTISTFVITAAPILSSDSIQEAIILNKEGGPYKSFEKRNWRPYGERDFEALLKRRGSSRTYSRRSIGEAYRFR
ncbi:hypothetical protein K502DRAFT_326517, partial [Neoconidiobolus thromboides FSU 785]